MEINSTEQDITTMHAELTAICERVQKLILVKENAASHRLDEIYHLQLLEKLVAWRRNNEFARSEVLTERKRRTRGRVCSVDDPKHCKIEYALNHDGHARLKKSLKVCRWR